MRWTRRRRMTNAVAADGEAVWSWRPDAGVKSRGSIHAAMVARKPGHQGERGVSRKPSRRESRIASAEPVCSCAFFCALLHTRPRVQRAPGFPCALLLFSRATVPRKARAHRAAATRAHGLALLTVESEARSVVENPVIKHRSSNTRHCERSEAIHGAANWKDGLLRRFRSSQ